MKYIINKDNGVVRVIGPPTTIKEIIQNLNDGDYFLEIKKKRKKRSNNQNNFYWGPFLECILTEMGEINKDFMSSQEIEDAKQIVHEFLKAKFGDSKTKNIVFKNPTDKRKRFTLSYNEASTTKEMDTKEFEQYLERIRNYFARWGWKLPYPEDEQEYNYLTTI